MTQQYTPAQLEAWAGLGPWEWCENWLYVANPNPPPGPVLWYTADDDGVHAEPNDATLIAAAPDLARLVLEKEKEIARLRAKLSQTPTAEWFYNPDDWEYSYESPRHVIDCMDLPDGNHVIRVDAAAVKPIYCAVKIATNDPDAPWPYTLTEHETEDEARQAMKETSDE